MDTPPSITNRKQKVAGQLDLAELSCAICMELLYKPCVNSCGHTFCFWCFHFAMDVLRTEHPCPLCRTSFRHLPAVCWPLHRYLVHNFKEEMEARETDIQKLEREEYHAESPSMSDDLKSKNFLSIHEEFKCVECGNLAAPPTVLSCGHAVCCYKDLTAGSSKSICKKRKCPIAGCIGKVVGNAPSTCVIIDKILQTDISPSSYNEAVSVSQKCVGLIQDVESSDDDVYSNGDICILHGLGSAKGSQFNGKKVKIVSFNSKSNRYAVEVIAPTTIIKHLSVKTANLEKIHNDNDNDEGYIHYGVGCDGCGQYPIKGRRYKCQECSEAMGFDLCGNCLDMGVHTNVGRFNQKHTPDHKMREVQGRTIFHQFQATNPDVPLPQLMNMIGMQFVPNEDDGEDP